MFTYCSYAPKPRGRRPGGRIYKSFIFNAFHHVLDARNMTKCTHRVRTLQKMCANQSCPRCESQSFRRECNLSNPCVPGRTCIETSMHMRTTVGLTLMRSEGPLTNTTHCKSAPRTKGRHNSKTPDFDASFLKNVCGTILSFILKAEKCACTIPSTSVDRLEEQVTKGNQTKHKSQSKILKSSSF